MTLTEALNSKRYHYESMDEGAVIYVSDAKEVFKEWLKTVGLPNYHTLGRDGNTFNATESLRKLLIALVDEP